MINDLFKEVLTRYKKKSYPSIHTVSFRLSLTNCGTYELSSFMPDISASDLISQIVEFMTMPNGHRVGGFQYNILFFMYYLPLDTSYTPVRSKLESIGFQKITEFINGNYPTRPNKGLTEIWALSFTYEDQKEIRKTFKEITTLNGKKESS